MTITLTPEHEQMLAKAMQTGGYRSADDVISRALEMLNEEENWLSEQEDSVEAKIERAFAQFERGEFPTAEESRAHMEARKVTL